MLSALGLLASVQTGFAQCYGTTANGRLQGGQYLPQSGPNFESYWSLAQLADRNALHPKIRQLVLDSYQQLAQSFPQHRFVYGETGHRQGGSFAPHKTHQNGLSVDFFVPVLDAASKPARLPQHLANRFGYDIEFDRQGRYQEYRIDFDAMAAHLQSLLRLGKRQGTPVQGIIFDPDFTRSLRATQVGRELPEPLFRLKKPWVRHDEHYHVDFLIPCLPLTKFLD